MMVVIRLEVRQLFLQIAGIPEECMVKIFTANSADESLNEGMRLRCIGDGLDLIYTQNSQICLPLVIQE